jgi:DNA-directed RNA polymerase specialized sigma subunit
MIYPEVANKKRFFHPDEIEWLMQPDEPEHNMANDWQMIDAIGEIVASLDATDQRMIHLIYYERKTFQEAAKEIGILAKSHAWRKTKSALKKFETALRNNKELMELLETKYGIVGETNETEL